MLNRNILLGEFFMKISKIDDNTSFKAIKLNGEEITKADALLRTYTNTARNNEKLLDIFDSHIKKEAEQKAADKFSAKDVLQEMYLKFFEVLNEKKEKKLQAQDLVKTLDEFTPGENELITSSDTIPISAKLKHVLPEKSNKSNSEAALNHISQICDKSNLSEAEKAAILKKGQGYEDTEIFPNFYKDFAAAKLEIIIEKIQLANGIIPTQIAKKIQRFEKNYGMHFKENNMIDALKADSFLFSKFCNNATVYNNLKNTSQKLEVKENDYKKLVELFPILLTKHDDNYIGQFILNAKRSGMSAQAYTTYSTKSPEYFFLKYKPSAD